MIRTTEWVSRFTENTSGRRSSDQNTLASVTPTVDSHRVLAEPQVVEDPPQWFQCLASLWLRTCDEHRVARQHVAERARRPPPGLAELPLLRLVIRVDGRLRVTNQEDHAGGLIRGRRRGGGRRP